MPAFLLAAPILLLGIVFYMLFPIKDLLVWILPPMIAYVGAIMVLSKKINMWWYQRHPPKEDPELMEVVKRFFPYYMRLEEAEKLRFEHRLSLFNMEMEYLTQEMPDVPPDVMVLLSSTAQMVTFGMEDFMYPKWEKIVLYRQAFHTPRIQEFHTGELHEEDGVVIIATDPFVKGLRSPNLQFNIAIHHFANAMAVEENLNTSDYLILEEEPEDRGVFIKAMLSKIRNWEKRFEKDYLPIADEELFGLCVEHFFVAPNRFLELWPATFKALSKLLNQDPRNKTKPVVNFVPTTKFMKKGKYKK